MSSTRTIKGWHALLAATLVAAGALAGLVHATLAQDLTDRAAHLRSRTEAVASLNSATASAPDEMATLPDVVAAIEAAGAPVLKADTTAHHEATLVLDTDASAALHLAATLTTRNLTVTSIDGTAPVTLTVHLSAEGQ